MFQPGELIIYGNSGVCKVVKVGAAEVTAADENRLYYTLAPLYSSETIYIPVDTRAFMRPIISGAEARALVERIPAIEETTYTNNNLNLLKENYETALRTHDCEALAQLIKSIYVKNIGATQNGRQIGQVDQRYMRRAEDLLYGELAVALEIPCDEVVKYIEKTVAEAAEKS